MHYIAGLFGFLLKSLRADCFVIIIGAAVIAALSFFCGGGVDHMIFVH